MSLHQEILFWQCSKKVYYDLLFLPPFFLPSIDVNFVIFIKTQIGSKQIIIFIFIKTKIARIDSVFCFNPLQYGNSNRGTLRNTIQSQRFFENKRFSSFLQMNQ